MAALDENPLFQGLTPARRADLVAAAERRKYAPGEIILADGQPAEWVFALERGRVRIFHAINPEAQIVIKAFSAPALFGEAEVFAGIAYLETVAALTQVELIAIPGPVFLALVKEQPSVSVALCFDLGTRLAISSYDERAIASDPATIRLANYLLDYAEWIRAETEELWVDLTQDDMARAIGVTRRSIAKDIANWQKERILVRTPRGYRVANPEKLSRFADPKRMTLHYSLKKDLVR